jgi:hypothetical protein
MLLSLPLLHPALKGHSNTAIGADTEVVSHTTMALANSLDFKTRACFATYQSLSLTTNREGRMLHTVKRGALRLKDAAERRELLVSGLTVLVSLPAPR